MINLSLFWLHVHSFHGENILRNMDDNQIKNYECFMLIVYIFSYTEFCQNVMLVQKLHHCLMATLIHKEVIQQ